MTIDGREVAVLAVADFNRLDACRRQLGASEAQAHQLRQQLHDARRRLARLEGRLAGASNLEAPARDSGVRVLALPTLSTIRAGSRSDVDVTSGRLTRCRWSRRRDAG
ncbi:hypothetical protein [Micromonospora sp. NBC_01638]|uniref:hypothetical protein n=1 Tax=Micromonospora sp. NBC_01638 TaxID=2975982 RepID=UPI00386C5EBD|nr:hypothetical protein OG811_31440 [Micromonospora sp. NBC_01638]